MMTTNVLKPPYDILYKVDNRDVQRFMSKTFTNVETGCWEWTASKDKDGYGTFQVANGHQGEKQRAHVVSFAMFKGIWPTLYVLHTCHNQACVYPLHLYEGTQADNIKDEINRGTFARGSRSGVAVMTEEIVIKARYDYRKGRTLLDISLDLGMSVSAMSNAIKGITWKHVPNPVIVMRTNKSYVKGVN